MTTDDQAARLAQSAAEHLCRASAFSHEPILATAAATARITARVQLQLALDALNAPAMEQAA